MLVSCVGFYLFVIKMNKNIQHILPDQCIFSVTDGLARESEENITNYIAGQYSQSKNPQSVISSVNQKFPEVRDMKVYLCKTDKICFSVELQQPIFLLNEQDVVCDNDVILSKEHFQNEVVAQLPRVYCDHKISIGVARAFFEKLPKEIQKSFAILWGDENDIALYEHENKKIQFLVTKDSVPTVVDINHCKEIGSTLGSKYKKKSITYDLRFKNQIIVR